jgi:hypothetical protein
MSFLPAGLWVADVVRDPNAEALECGAPFKFSGRVGVSPAGLGILPKPSFQVGDRETRSPAGETPTLPETKNAFRRLIRGPRAEALGYCRGISGCGPPATQSRSDFGRGMRSTAVPAVWRVGVSPAHREETSNNRRDACWPHSQDGRAPIKRRAGARARGRLEGRDLNLPCLFGRKPEVRDQKPESDLITEGIRNLFHA